MATGDAANSAYMHADGSCYLLTRLVRENSSQQA